MSAGTYEARSDGIHSKCVMTSAVTPVNSAGKADGVPFFSRFPMDGAEDVGVEEWRQRERGKKE